MKEGGREVSVLESIAIDRWSTYQCSEVVAHFKTASDADHYTQSLTEGLGGGACWLADGVHFKPYRPQLGMGKDVASIEYKCGLAHHALKSHCQCGMEE